jgi:hypothetical protein
MQAYQAAQQRNDKMRAANAQAAQQGYTNQLGQLTTSSALQTQAQQRAAQATQQAEWQKLINAGINPEATETQNAYLQAGGPDTGMTMAEFTAAQLPPDIVKGANNALFRVNPDGTVTMAAPGDAPEGTGGWGSLKLDTAQNQYGKAEVVKAYQARKAAADNIGALFEQKTPMSDAAAVMMYAKAVNGGAALTDSDFNVLVARGGVWERIGSWLNKAQTGKLTATERQQITGAAQTLLTDTTEELRTYQNNITPSLGNHRPEDVFHLTGLLPPPDGPPPPPPPDSTVPPGVASALSKRGYVVREDGVATDASGVVIPAWMVGDLLGDQEEQANSAPAYASGGGFGEWRDKTPAGGYP